MEYLSLSIGFCQDSLVVSGLWTGGGVAVIAKKLALSVAEGKQFHVRCN